LVEPYVECEALGERKLKGKAEPVPVYRLGVARRHVETFRSPAEASVGAPLVGRDDELATIRKCIERLLAGVGGVVSVSGDAGLGKSRLMAEVRRHVATQPLRWLEGRGLSFGQTTSYWPFLELIRAAVGITEDDSEDMIWAKLERHLAAPTSSGVRPPSKPTFSIWKVNGGGGPVTAGQRIHGQLSALP